MRYNTRRIKNSDLFSTTESRREEEEATKGTLVQLAFKTNDYQVTAGHLAHLFGLEVDVYLG